ADGAMAERRLGIMMVATLPFWLDLSFGNDPKPSSAPATISTTFAKLQLIEAAKLKLQNSKQLSEGTEITWKQLGVFADPPLKADENPRDVWGNTVGLGTIGSPPKLSMRSAARLRQELSAAELRLWRRFL